jgi:hypothetical protein
MVGREPVTRKRQRHGGQYGPVRGLGSRRRGGVGRSRPLGLRSVLLDPPRGRSPEEVRGRVCFDL